MKKLLVGIFVCISINCLAQDPEFTQFYANPLYLNPAFAGSARCPRLALNYRNQWPSLQGTFVTYSASYDQQVDALSGGLGLLAMSDKAGEGTITTNNISAIYAYQLTVNREFSIRFGVQGTYIQKNIDWSKLTFGDQIDPRYGFIYNTNEIQPNTNKGFVDLSAGVLAYSNFVYGGVAVNHLTEPNEAFFANSTSNLPMKITGHVGAIIPLDDSRDASTYISPNILYQQQQDFRQLNIGLYVAKLPLVGGIWYRNNDSFILLVGLQQGVFKFGYSYDVTVSKLSNVSGGSHELSMGLQFPCHPKKKRFRPVKCQKF